MNPKQFCYCCSKKEFKDCCEPFIKLQVKPDTAEELMRSRYTAYALCNATYIVDTTHPRNRHLHSKKAISNWAKENTWIQLEVVKTEDYQVIFKAYYNDVNGNSCVHYEDSLFEKLGENWYYVSGVFLE
ncbi:hypothetical protein LNQ81_04620 [Myroides sp. M-43]|uniref:YchJ family protein n=1 Tax=Myroides oncorhynchi TaxID=2893756 RepID=UPI001E3A93B8|nr:YchJ family metal-binding protein [Myroides oncorhynchi]MCC9041985.1 hypothetical protein [Myroides oncorhynchi]